MQITTETPSPQTKVQPTKRIYLSPPHMSGLEEGFVKEAFDSNWITTLGPNVEAFEKEICAYTGRKGALALFSGTGAIHLGLKALGIKRGDFVFCPTFTFSASANPILYEGAIPVFIDSEPETWNLSPLALERAFESFKRRGKLPSAVIIVDIFGQSADMDLLLPICTHYGVPVLEDAAESLGASYRGKKSGAFGKVSALSFNGNKIITSSGGGMLLSDDLSLIEKARHWSTQARDPARHYQHSEIGYNYRMSNIVAGVGRGQLRILDERVRQKREIHARYERSLADVAGIGFMPEASFGMHTRWLTNITLDPQVTSLTPTQLMDAFDLLNVEGRPLWKPLHRQPIFSTCDYFPHETGRSISDELFATGLSLPCGTAMTLDEQDRIVDCIRKQIRSHRVS